MKMIITSGRGVYLDKLPNINENRSIKSNIIIIISDKKIISKLINNEINILGIYSMEFIYISILKQKLDIGNNILLNE
jgi:hypothetical protein